MLNLAKAGSSIPVKFSLGGNLVVSLHTASCASIAMPAERTGSFHSHASVAASASCGGRRMADTAAHLVDRVLPEVPVRQWVLSLPFALRYRLAYDAHLRGPPHLF